MYFSEEFFRPEVRDGFFVNGSMKRAWAAQREVLKVISDICAKYDIPWFAEPEVTFAEVALPASSKPVSDPAIDFCPDVVIRTRPLTIEVSNHASREMLSLIQSVMKNAT